MQTWIQRSFAPVKRRLPGPIADFIRSAVTAYLTPLLHYYQSGHFRSSFAMRAVDRRGRPVPWYTYPCIDFLTQQSFGGRHILEFGAGQSTHWWASVAETVVALETEEKWFKELHRQAPSNATIYHLLSPDAATCQASARDILSNGEEKRFDIVVIDGAYREEMIEIAVLYLTHDGAIICDNSDSYRCFFESFKGRGFQRVDFYGAAPGVVLRECTSIFFKERCFLFDNSRPIANFNE